MLRYVCCTASQTSSMLQAMLWRQYMQAVHASGVHVHSIARVQAAHVCTFNAIHHPRPCSCASNTPQHDQHPPHTCCVKQCQNIPTHMSAARCHKRAPQATNRQGCLVEPRVAASCHVPFQYSMPSAQPPCPMYSLHPLQVTPSTYVHRQHRHASCRLPCKHSHPFSPPIF